MKTKNNKLPTWATKAPKDNIADLPGEIWQCPAKYLFNDERGMVEFPMLAVSTMGRVKAIAYQKYCNNRLITHNAYLLKVRPNKDNRAVVGFRATYDVHRNKHFEMNLARLVLSTFVPNPDPTKYTHCNHKNENTMDARLENLEWMTPKENNNYGNRNRNVSASKTGKKPSPEAIEKTAAANRKPVIANGIFYNSVKDCACALGISAANLTHYLKTGIFPAKYSRMKISYAEEAKGNEIG